MVDDGAYFQSDNKYTVVMTAQGESLVRTPLRELLDKLDPVNFKQIHRGTIVNMKAIASIVRDDTGSGTIKLKNRPETLTVSLTFMPLFKNMSMPILSNQTPCRQRDLLGASSRTRML